MSSILIKNIEIPKSCGDCRFCAGLADTEWGTCAGCLIDDEYREASSKSGCPLIEVHTPHGRLIDVDKLKENHSDFEHLYVIDDAPIVIEMER